MKFSKLLVLALFVLPILAIGQANRSPYIGYEYKGVVPSATLPNGVKHFGGGLIGKIDADQVHGISEVAKGRTKMLWFEVSTGKDASGITGWRVLDVLSFSTLRKTDYLLFSVDPSIECSRNGNPLSADADIVGVGTILRRQGTFKPSKLWKANLVTEKFEPVSLAGVKCEYSEP